MLLRLTVDDFKVVLRDVGILLKWSSLTFIVPLLSSLIFFENTNIIVSYLLVGIFTFAFGLFLKTIFKVEEETDLRHAFITTSIIWILFTALAAIPFVLIFKISFLDAFFEVMSALTTTGLSLVVNLDSMPLSLIFWRSFLSWIGGIGIIVLALVGVLSTYSKSTKLVVAEGRKNRILPSLKNTVKEIWFLYVILTIFGILLLYVSGMDLFNSINYSMSAISTTGMDISEAGLLGLSNVFISGSLILLMILGAISFSTHYLFIRKKKWSAYFDDKEAQVFIGLTIISVLLITPKLIVFYGSEFAGLHFAIFHTVSAITCGGFSLDSPANVSMWGDFVKLILVGVMIIGGSAGSTAGGIKVSRFWIFVKSIYWKMKEVVLPENSFFARKFEGRIVEDKEVKEITQFILLYFGFLVIGVLLLSMEGINLGDAIFEVASAQGNVGISSGIVYPGMSFLSKIVLTFSMWVGRLEIIPIMAIFGFLLNFKGSKNEVN